MKLSEEQILYKLGDPGIAKNTATINAGEKSSLGQMMSLFYAAPEQLELFTPTKKLDSWPVGIIYYQLCNGSFDHPFPIKDVPSIHWAKIYKDQ